MQKDWKKFYQEGLAPLEPSTFAKFVAENYLSSKSIKWRTGSILDMGCGNRRDSMYFESLGYVVNSVDPYVDDEYVIKAFSNEYPITEDVVYSRFFLHTIDNEDIVDLIDNTPNLFMAECRAIGDQPRLYTTHTRNFIDFEWLKSVLKNKGFHIKFDKLSRGLAPYEWEDPLIIRVIAQR